MFFSGLGITDVDHRMDTPAHIEIRVDFHPPGLRGFDQVIQDLIRDLLMEGPFIAIAPKIEFQAFELHAELIGDVADPDLCEIRLAGLRAKTGEFRTFDIDRIIAPRIRILEDLEFS